MKENIIRSERSPGSFVSIDKGFLNDRRLSLKAKGLLAYLLSKPNDWQVYQTELQKASSDGRTAISNALNELITFGYVERVKARQEGRFLGVEYRVHEKPCLLEETVSP